MNFETGHIYHIYNQGNNRQVIFFNRKNYLFFIEKIKIYVLPYTDILAWCLMPNHFHLMVYVKRTSLASAANATVGVTAHKASDEDSPSNSVHTRTFNDSIGIMLRSYTRAVNIQEKRSGALFREATKSICLTKSDNNIPVWYYSSGAAAIWTNHEERQYTNICFNYIIMNPVRSGLVPAPSLWEFSSYNELKGNDKILISEKRINEFNLNPTQLSG